MKNIFPENQVNYILRMYLPHWNYEAIRDEIIRFCKESGTEHVMLFTDAQHMVWNQLTIEEAKKEAANIARAIKDLGEHGIKVGINSSYNMVQSKFDHREHNSQYKHWVTHADGNCPHTSPCLLDPALKDYLTEFYGILASTDAEYIHVDDDHRYIDAGKANTYGCMCDLHISEFSKLTGKEWTRAALHYAVYHDPEVRREWAKFLKKGLEDIAEVIEKAVHNVNPEMRVGVMVPCLHALAAYDYELPKMLKLFQPTGKFLIRPCIGPYSDFDRNQIVPGLFYMGTINHIIGDAAEYTPEVETTPFSRMHKSITSIHFTISQGIINRMPNPAVSACGYVGNSPYFEPEIAKMLAKQRPFFESLLKIAPERGTKKGIGMKFSPHSVVASPVPRDSFVQLAWPSFTLHDFLSSNGLSVTYDDSDILFLAGDTVYALSEEEIMDYLKNKHLVLDAEAAQAFVARGYQEYIGCRVVETSDPVRAEYFSNPDYCGIYTGTYSPLKDTPLADIKKIVDTDSKAEILSVITDHDMNVLSPAVTLFEHKLGKKVAVMNYALPAANPTRRHLICYQKQVQLQNLFRTLAPMTVPVTVTDPTCFMVQYFDDNKHAFVSFINPSYDVAEEITVTFADPDLDIANGVYIREDGEIRPLSEIAEQVGENQWKFRRFIPIFRIFAVQIPKKS